MKKRFSIIGMLITTIISSSNLQTKWQKIPSKKKVIELAIGATDQMWAFILENRLEKRLEKRKKMLLYLAKWNKTKRKWDKKLPLPLEKTIYDSLSVAPDGSVFFLAFKQGTEKLQRFKNGTLKTIRDFTKSKDDIRSIAALGRNSVVILKEGRRFTGKISKSGAKISDPGTYVEKWDGSSWKQLGQFIKETDPGISLNPIAAGADGALYIGGSIVVGEGGVLIYTWDGSSWKQVTIDITPANRINLAVVKKNDFWLLLKDERLQIQNLLHWDGTKLEKKNMAPVKWGRIAAGPSGVIMYNQGSMYKWTEK